MNYVTITEEEAEEQEINLEDYYDDIPDEDIEKIYEEIFEINKKMKLFLDLDVINKLYELYKKQVHEFYKIEELINEKLK